MKASYAGRAATPTENFEKREAMAGVNRVIVIGRLGRDPEVRYTTNGAAVANFPVATSDEWKDKETGEKRERTEWHRIVAWRRLGEICGEYLRKGSQVFIEGKVQTRAWEDKDGNKRYTTEIIAQNMQMLDSAGRQAQGESADDRFPEDEPLPGTEDDEIPF